MAKCHSQARPLRQQAASAALALLLVLVLGAATHAAGEDKLTDLLTSASVTLATRVSSNVQLLTDVDVVIFSLNLEYLAANFWSCVAYGKGLDESLRGGGPPAKGCKKAALSDPVQKLVEEVAFDEVSHVQLLRTQLKGCAPPQPAIDLGAGNAFVDQAVGQSGFDASRDDVSALIAGFILSDAEPTIYRAAISLLRHTTLKSVAGGIQGTEGYHGGALRTLLIQRSGESVAPYGKSVADVVQAVSDLRDKLDADGVDDDQGIYLNGKPNAVPTDSNGLVFYRNPGAALRILYDGGFNGGGFFPSGINGRVRNTAQGRRLLSGDAGIMAGVGEEQQA